ncbi:protein NYNRIN-like [Gossypium australe]|uniref:Protein NYNRIN-like n=1 Tax=Gossypium australe TaxID=47621 RepID=A0A5B6V8V6_9ROSI|nr:protein NYNRIN-like [Gossypium australe]
MSPYKLVYGKHYHYPIELEKKACLAIKKLNLDAELAKKERKSRISPKTKGTLVQLKTKIILWQVKINMDRTISYKSSDTSWLNRIHWK